MRLLGLFWRFGEGNGKYGGWEREFFGKKYL